MEASFWHERWELDQIGFHVNETNPLLINNIGKLGLDKGARLFLPLCGKTLDIAYLLEQGYKIVGVELSEIAIEELFKQLDLSPNISIVGDHKLFSATDIEIYVGDFFALTSDILGEIDAIYDRASLIALPLDMRKAYTKHLAKVTHNTQQLMVCIEYDQTVIQGPPFSISPAEVNQHYENIYDIKCVEIDDIAGGLKRKVEATESAWILKPKT